MLLDSLEYCEKISHILNSNINICDINIFYHLDKSLELSITSNDEQIGFISMCNLCDNKVNICVFTDPTDIMDWDEEKDEQGIPYPGEFDIDTHLTHESLSDVSNRILDILKVTHPHLFREKLINTLLDE